MKRRDVDVRDLRRREDSQASSASPSREHSEGLGLQPVRQIFQTVHRVHRVLPTVRGVVENAVDELPRSRPPTLQSTYESKKELQILERQGRNTLASKGMPDLAAIQRQHGLDPRCPARGEKRCQYADGDEHDCAADV